MSHTDNYLLGGVGSVAGDVQSGDSDSTSECREWRRGIDAGVFGRSDGAISVACPRAGFVGDNYFHLLYRQIVGDSHQFAVVPISIYACVHRYHYWKRNGGQNDHHNKLDNREALGIGFSPLGDFSKKSSHRKVLVKG